MTQTEKETANTLRETHDKHLMEKASIVNEAALMWFEKNVVLINEQLDRRTVKRIIDSITKFDSVFGKYKPKIPSIGKIISDTEDELQSVLIGKSSEKKAGIILKKLSYYFSSFSNFLSSDLPVLLSSHLFSAAKQNPDVKLNVLQPKEGMRHDPAMILNALKHALIPNKEEQALMKKIYKKSFPLIDAQTVANELLMLSYNELKELSSVDKVPIMAIPDNEQPATPAAPATTEEPKPVGESVEPENNKVVILESHKLLLELNQKQMTKVIDIMNQLQSNFNIAGMEPVHKSLQSLLSKARKELAGNKWFQGSAVKQLVGFYNLMDNLNQQWPQIKQLFSDNKLEANEQADLQRLLQSVAQDNVFGKLAKAFKLQSPHAPGLDPNSVVKGIMAAANQEDGLNAISGLFEKAKGLPKTDPSTGEPNVQGQTSPADKATETKEANKTVKPDQTKGTETGTSPTPSTEAEEASKDSIVSDIIAQNPHVKGMTPEGIGAQLDMFQRAGYKISKK